MLAIVPPSLHAGSTADTLLRRAVMGRAADLPMNCRTSAGNPAGARANTPGRESRPVSGTCAQYCARSTGRPATQH